MRLREEEAEADRPARLHRERDRHEDRAAAARHLDRETEGDDVSPTKPKLWSGPEKKPAARKKAAEKPAEPQETLPVPEDDRQDPDEQADPGYMK